ncbi:MAG: 4-hydroxy-3-methylbut-2-enyl diphosphate reductase [Bacilli bacterium]|nr:4-hydroxy-3-methylbut-2-enyl diphosphate reductase [Bacilli bacterium]
MKAYEIKPNGFCNGVKRAIRMINEIVNDSTTPRPIYMFGYLVHNKKIINSFIEDYNVILIKENYIENLTKIKEGTVIFTAHGISPKIKQIAIDNKLNIVDTTCPNVFKIQKLIKEKVSNNYNVLVIGNNNHPETMSYLGISDKVSLFNKELDYSNLEKVFVINQTTLIYEDVLKSFELIKNQNINAEIVEEICNATKIRQKALKENLDNFDCFIIVGDKLSNNCDSLYKIAIQNNKDAYKIETVEELNDIDLTKYKKIGITAGASTPPKILYEIIDQINSKSHKYISTLNNNDYINV